MTLQTMLRHPIYAGAYRWGYRKIDPRKQQPGRPNTGKTVNAPESCEVFVKDRFPAYISWERFEAIQQRLANNRARLLLDSGVVKVAMSYNPIFAII
jgi:hypothetical protein